MVEGGQVVGQRCGGKVKRWRLRRALFRKCHYILFTLRGWDVSEVMSEVSHTRKRR